jgi:hypothetical protein
MSAGHEKCLGKVRTITCPHPVQDPVVSQVTAVRHPAFAITDDTESGRNVGHSSNNDGEADKNVEQRN